MDVYLHTSVAAEVNYTCMRITKPWKAADYIYHLKFYALYFSKRAIGLMNIEKDLFSKYELISKLKVGFKPFLQQALSEPKI